MRHFRERHELDRFCNGGTNQPATYDGLKTDLKNIEGKRIWPAFGRHMPIYSSRQWAFNDSFKKKVKTNLNSTSGAYRYMGYGTILGVSYFWAKYPPGAKSMSYKGEGGLKAIIEQDEEQQLISTTLLNSTMCKLDLTMDQDESTSTISDTSMESVNLLDIGTEIVAHSKSSLTQELGNLELRHKTGLTQRIENIDIGDDSEGKGLTQDMGGLELEEGTKLTQELGNLQQDTSQQPIIDTPALIDLLTDLATNNNRCNMNENELEPGSRPTQELGIPRHDTSHQSIIDTPALVDLLTDLASRNNVCEESTHGLELEPEPKNVVGHQHNHTLEADFDINSSEFEKWSQEFETWDIASAMLNELETSITEPAQAQLSNRMTQIEAMDEGEGGGGFGEGAEKVQN